MVSARKEASPRIPAQLLKVITSEFDHQSWRRASDLFDQFFRHRYYSREFALALLKTARGQKGDAWKVRQLAALMLENQFLKLSAEDPEFNFLLARLAIYSDATASCKVGEFVLKEGFSTTCLPEFAREFRARLERLNRIHDKINCERVSKSALADFISAARHDSKLSIARYVFSPEEVVAQILRQLQITRGLTDVNTLQYACVNEETERALSSLPAYERRILELLREGSRVYWVSESTSSEINSMVEYPLTTVVLVIKPPGSHVELEIKRAGRRRSRPLSAVHSRDGSPVPPSHRFDGGSTQWMLRYEANMASKLSSIYRIIHNTEAPVSRFISRSCMYNVPAGEKEESILTYFTDERIFGEGFDEMRREMKASVDAFDQDNDAQPFEIPGDIGLTMRFLTHIRPTQAIVCGTSSFRLDKLAAYLSNDGAALYFGEGLGVEYSNADARRFADEMLEEALCVYAPPGVRYRSYGQYVQAAFAVEENRLRADRNFLFAMRQTGEFYGTLLAMRAASSGESFVARNVGLRSAWEAGEWRIKLIFMDHDSLSICHEERENYNSLGAHMGTSLDELYIWGKWEGREYVTGSVDCLRRIYRVSERVYKDGEQQFFCAMKDAYKKTHREMAANPALEKYFHRSFLDQIGDWDFIVREYLSIKDKSTDLDEWKEKIINRFVAEGREKNIIVEHLVAVERFSSFLERYSFLY